MVAPTLAVLTQSHRASLERLRSSVLFSMVCERGGVMVAKGPSTEGGVFISAVLRQDREVVTALAPPADEVSLATMRRVVGEVFRLRFGESYAVGDVTRLARAACASQRFGLTPGCARVAEAFIRAALGEVRILEGIPQAEVERVALQIPMYVVEELGMSAHAIDQLVAGLEHSAADGSGEVGR